MEVPQTIETLIQQLQSGTEDEKAIAAGVLGRLANDEIMAGKIATAGGIDPLVVPWHVPGSACFLATTCTKALAQHGGQLGQENATQSLWSLLTAGRLREEEDWGPLV